MLSCEFCEIFLEDLFCRTTVSGYNLITSFGMIKLFGMAELFRQTKFSVWSNYLIWSNYSIWSHYSVWSNYSIKLPNLFKVVFIWEKTSRTSRVQPGKPSASVSWDDFYFRLHEKFRPGLQGWKCLVVLFWVWLSLILVTVQPSLLSVPQHSFLA